MSKIEYKQVELPDYDNVPRWLLLTGEIDLRYFLLEQMFKGWDRRDGLTKMIDQATGYEEKLQADGKELASEINWLRREYDKETANLSPQGNNIKKGTKLDISK